MTKDSPIVRHVTSGTVCRSASPAACELAFPGSHHAPTHVRPVPATLGTTPIYQEGRHTRGGWSGYRGDALGDRIDAIRRLARS